MSILINEDYPFGIFAQYSFYSAKSNLVLYNNRELSLQMSSFPSFIVKYIHSFWSFNYWIYTWAVLTILEYKVSHIQFAENEQSQSWTTESTISLSHG
jgi:hypothetical protein